MSKECPSCHEKGRVVYQCRDDDCGVMYCFKCGRGLSVVEQFVGFGALKNCPKCEGPGDVVSVDDEATDSVNDENASTEEDDSSESEEASYESYSSLDDSSSSDSSSQGASDSSGCLVLIIVLVLAVLVIITVVHETNQQLARNLSETLSQANQTRQLECTGISPDGTQCYDPEVGWVPFKSNNESQSPRQVACAGISEDGARCYSRESGWVIYSPQSQSTIQNQPQPVSSRYNLDQTPSRTRLPSVSIPMIDGGYKNPFQYCSAVVNRDDGEIVTDTQYTGMQPPDEVINAVGKASKIENYKGPVEWSCMDATVYGCNVGASGRGCRLADMSEQQLRVIRKFCQENPDSVYVPSSANYSDSDWGCGAGIPYIIATYPVDQAGYMKDSWVKVDPNDLNSTQKDEDQGSGEGQSNKTEEKPSQEADPDSSAPARDKAPDP